MSSHTFFCATAALCSFSLTWVYFCCSSASRSCSLCFSSNHSTWRSSTTLKDKRHTESRSMVWPKLLTKLKKETDSPLCLVLAPLSLGAGRPQLLPDSVQRFSETLVCLHQVTLRVWQHAQLHLQILVLLLDQKKKKDLIDFVAFDSSGRPTVGLVKQLVLTYLLYFSNLCSLSLQLVKLWALLLKFGSE